MQLYLYGIISPLCFTYFTAFSTMIVFYFMYNRKATKAHYFINTCMHTEFSCKFV